MPVTRAIERNSLSLSTGPQKAYILPTQLSTMYEEQNATSHIQEKVTPRRVSDATRKSNGSARDTTSTILTQAPRRTGTTNDGTLVRGRSNTDTQSSLPLSNGLRQQSTTARGRANTDTQSSINVSTNEKLAPQQHQTSATVPPPKPKCKLPASTNQSGYVTPSKLFNMMGYGLQNQYLFMQAQYLYIIDCRSREKFNESHITTGIHWEDALDGTVYISLVERFSEIVLYDESGQFNETEEVLIRITNRFPSVSSKICASLSGGFQAFRALFPFLCTQSNVRSTVDREKFLTIYPSVVIDNQLYLGTGNQATNWKVVRDLNLTHIINISIEHKCVFSDKIKYLHLELEDQEDVPLKHRFDEAIEFIETALKNPSNCVLVHCNLGISRSTTLILAYLMKTYNATLLEAYKFLRHRRPIVCPNIGFLYQLADYEYELFSYNYTDPQDPMFY